MENLADTKHYGGPSRHWRTQRTQQTLENVQTGTEEFHVGHRTKLGSTYLNLPWQCWHCSPTQPWSHAQLPLTHLPAWQPFSQGLEEEEEDEEVMEEAPACATRCSSSRSPAHLLHAAEAPVQARACIPSVSCVFVSAWSSVTPRAAPRSSGSARPTPGWEVEVVQSAVTRRRRRSRTKT